MTEPPEVRGPSVLLAACGWALAGVVVGTAAGTTLQLVGRVENIAPIAGTSAGVWAALGALAGGMEARRARSRPVLADGAGRPVRRGGVWLALVPLVAAAVGFATLVVLATVQQASPWVGAGFAVAAVGCVAVARSVWTHGVLARAAEDAALGRRRDAARAWMRLATAWWATRTGRTHAALNLGLASVIDGDVEAAARWYGQVTRGRAAAFARVGMALVRTRQGAWAPAEQALAAAASAGRSLQPEVDGVRMLLVLRRDGPAAARRLGEGLLSSEAGTLFLGVLAAARRATGDPDGADALLADGLADALRHTGLARLLPELGDVGWDPELLAESADPVDGR